MLDEVTATVMDIAPTAAAALGLPQPDASHRAHPHDRTPARHVLLLFLDGFGYARYTEARDAGLIPTLAALDEPSVGLTVYVPSTSVASAAMLTGAPPSVTGI